MPERRAIMARDGSKRKEAPDKGDAAAAAATHSATADLAIIDGHEAYVVVPAVFAFKERGVAVREAAQMTFVLEKDAAGWLIHGWTWTGPKPKAVAPAKP
jgi:hypothetical protein